MNRRDKFAIAAMSGVATMFYSVVRMNQVVADAYYVADLMVIESDKHRRGRTGLDAKAVDPYPVATDGSTLRMNPKLKLRKGKRYSNA